MIPEDLASSWVASADFVIRIAVALLFVLAAVPKLRDPMGFTEGVAQYEVIKLGQARLVAHLLPLLELGVAAWLTVGMLPMVSAVVAGALLLGFTLLVIRSIGRGRRFRCNCFGAGTGEIIGPGLLVRNVLLVGLLMFVALTDAHTWPSVALHDLRVGTLLASAASVAFTVLFVYLLRFLDIAIGRDLSNHETALIGRAQ